MPDVAVGWVYRHRAAGAAGRHLRVAADLPRSGWAAHTLANFASTPGFSVSIKGLGGVIPFDIRAERIEVSDAKGVWLLEIDNAQIDLSAMALISRHAQNRDIGRCKNRGHSPAGSE